jgi:hypothetical protein
MDIWLSHAMIGLIWGDWYLLFYLSLLNLLTENMTWFIVALLLVGTISHDVVYGEIRLAIESVLPVWVIQRSVMLSEKRSLLAVAPC